MTVYAWKRGGQYVGAKSSISQEVWFFILSLFHPGTTLYTQDSLLFDGFLIQAKLTFIKEHSEFFPGSFHCIVGRFVFKCYLRRFVD
jgi:hypothetical protein